MKRDLALAVALVALCALLGAALPVRAQGIPAAAGKYKRELVRQAHSQWGLNAPVAALAAQVHQESGWDAGAVSRVGARGMAQFMPGTARWWCERERAMQAKKPMPEPPPGRSQGGEGPLGGQRNTRSDEAWGRCSPHNPAWALRAMVGYDKYLFDRTPPHMSDFDRLWLALRAYNGGLGHWQAEARATGLRWPTRAQIDAACGQARRAPVHCRENLGYPRRILNVLQPRYAGWGAVWAMPANEGKQP